jgi:DNA-binding Xre family transcriptional regulator
MKRSLKKDCIIPESVSQHIEEQYKKSPAFRKAYNEEVMLLKIAYKIAQLRKQRHLTQGELARMAGTTQQNISRLEDSENTKVSLHTLARLAVALKARLNVDLVPLV